MRISVIGGGTGTRTVLESLRDEPRFELSAVVSMADNGGSTGKLREELGVLPPGDLRQCLLALSTLPLELKAVLEHRFNRGTINGHPIGNLLIAAAQEYCKGDIEEALCLAKALLQVRGDVVPVTTTSTHLKIEHGDETTYGEIQVVQTRLGNPRRCSLTNNPAASDSALFALDRADVIVIGPGNMYASLIPNFLVRGIDAAIRLSQARLVYLVNLVTSPGHTDTWDACDFTSTIETYIGRRMDVIIVNSRELSQSLLAEAPGSMPVELGALADDSRLIHADLVDSEPIPQHDGDLIVRNHLRHDPRKLGVLLHRLLLPS